MASSVTACEYFAGINSSLVVVLPLVVVVEYKTLLYTWYLLEPSSTVMLSSFIKFANALTWMDVTVFLTSKVVKFLSGTRYNVVKDLLYNAPFTLA